MDDLVELARTMRADGVDLDAVLGQLRGRGASIVDCLKIIREVEDLTVGEAKAIVDASEAWADNRVANQELRSSIVAALNSPDVEA